MSHRATGGSLCWPDSNFLFCKGLWRWSRQGKGEWAGSVSGGQDWFKVSARVCRKGQWLQGESSTVVSGQDPLWKDSVVP